MGRAGQWCIGGSREEDRPNRTWFSLLSELFIQYSFEPRGFENTTQHNEWACSGEIPTLLIQILTRCCLRIPVCLFFFSTDRFFPAFSSPRLFLLFFSSLRCCSLFFMLFLSPFSGLFSHFFLRILHEKDLRALLSFCLFLRS